MKHYELLKLVPGADTVAVHEMLWSCLRQMNDATDQVTHPVVYRSCREGDDYDLMIVVEIAEEESIVKLKSDSLTLALEGKIAAFIQDRRTFNHY